MSNRHYIPKQDGRGTRSDARLYQVEIGFIETVWRESIGIESKKGVKEELLEKMIET